MTERTLEMALGCLEPVLSKLVVVGGTAHRMFPLHELGRDPGFELLTTEDVDLAAPLELQHDATRELLNRLEAAGFTEQVRGAVYPTHTYHLPDDAGSYLQFIAPLTGSGLHHDGSRDQSMRFKGITAEKLRYVDILLHRPWTVNVCAEDRELPLQVVDPIAFLIQKLLVMPNRDDKRGKDLLYVFDTLSIFADSLDRLRDRGTDLVPALSPKAIGKVRRTAHELCFQESGVSRDAAAIAAGQRGNPPGSTQIVAACQLGLRQVLESQIPDL